MIGRRYGSIIVYDGVPTLPSPGGTSLFPEQVEVLAQQCEDAARALASQGFHRPARQARKTAKEWREIAVQLRAQRREELDGGSA